MHSGYFNPRPFIAAKPGLMAGTPGITERFLEDYARTQGDLIIEAYYGGLEQLAREYGMGDRQRSCSQD